MGVFILNGMTTGGAGNPDSLELEKFPPGHMLAALNMRATVPVTRSGATGNGTATDLQQLMLMAMGAFTLKDGTGAVPYPTVPGDELRQVHRLLNLNEVPNDIIGASFTQTNNYNVHFDLRLRMGFPWLARPESRYPGASQVRKFVIDIVEGSTVPTNFTRAAGNLLWDVDVETIESDTDQYAPVLGYFRDNQSRLYATGPDGLTVAAWDANAAFASTAIDLFSVSIGNDDMQLRKPYMVADAFKDGVLQGSGADISDSVTPIYMPSRNVDPDQLPHGRLTIRLASQYVSSIKLRGLYFPTISSEAAATATIQAAEMAKTAVAGSVQQSPVASPHPGVAATSPIKFFPANRPEFTLRPAIIGKPGATSVQISVPPTYKAAVQQSVSNFKAAGDATHSSALQNAAKQLGALLPGFTATSGGKSPGLLGLLGLN